MRVVAPSPVVRDAVAGDLVRCATTLAASHRHHPWDRWALTGTDVVPAPGAVDDVEGRLHRLTEMWFRLSVLPFGHGRVAAAGLAVAVWVPHDLAPLAPDVAETLDAVAHEVLGDRAAVVASVEAEVRAHRPHRPHTVLATLGTDPRHQRRGLASALLGDQCARFDDRGTLAVVETSSEANVSFYERFGFDVIADLPDLGGGCPPTWVLARPPR